MVFVVSVVIQIVISAQKNMVTYYTYLLSQNDS